MDCPKCRAKSTSLEVCSACGVIFSKYEISKTLTLNLNRNQQFESLTDNQPEPTIEIGAPIAVFALAALIVWLMPGLAWSVSMWIHEFGHAFAAWFGGIAATPFLGFTSYGAGQSWVVTICFTILLGLLSYLSWKNKSYFLVATFAGMFVMQMYYRFVLTEGELSAMCSYMGIGGEFWISTFFIVAFHYTFPPKVHWQFLRYPLLLNAAITYMNVLKLWVDVSHHRRDLPWGSMWGGDDVGDMNSLVNDWAWTQSEITSSYLRLGYYCLAVIVINYIVQASRALAKMKKPQLPGAF